MAVAGLAWLVSFGVLGLEGWFLVLGAAHVAVTAVALSLLGPVAPKLPWLYAQSVLVVWLAAGTPVSWMGLGFSVTWGALAFLGLLALPFMVEMMVSHRVPSSDR